MRFIQLILLAGCVWLFVGRSEVALADAVPIEQMTVPRDDVWALPMPVREELESLLQAGATRIDQLLSSQDAREVGLGLFALEQSADLDRLVTLVDLLEDNRPTVSYAGQTAGRGEAKPIDQTIGEYVAHIYAIWLGLSEQEVHERKEEIRNLGDPWASPYPWLVKAQRAARSVGQLRSVESRQQRLAQVKQEILALPQAVRWRVVVMKNGDSVADCFSSLEARNEVLSLDQTTKDQLVSGAALSAHPGEIGWEFLKTDVEKRARDILLSAE